MEITLTYGDLFVTREAIRSYTVAPPNVQDPVLSAKLSKILKIVNEHASDFENELEKLRKESSNKDKDGEPVIIEETDEEGNEIRRYDIKDTGKFQEDANNLRDMKVTFIVPTPLEFDDLASLRGHRENYPYQFISLLSEFIRG